MIGLAHSRAQVRDAVAVLDAAHLVMISTTTTADAIATVGGRRSSWFFRMAATDTAQAGAMKWWLDKGLLGGKRIDEREVAVLREANADDLYSADMAAAVRAKLPYARYRDFTDDTTLATQVEEACAQGAKALVFTARAEYLGKLVEAWRGCAAKPYILASDDVTGTLAEKPTGIERRKLLFVALRDLNAVELPLREVGQWLKGVSQTANPVHGQVAYEGTWLLTDALDLVGAGVAHLPSEVRYQLRGCGSRRSTPASTAIRPRTTPTGACSGSCRTAQTVRSGCASTGSAR